MHEKFQTVLMFMNSRNAITYLNSRNATKSASVGCCDRASNIYIYLKQIMSRDCSILIYGNILQSVGQNNSGI
jgi:hypothetical protein